MNNPSFNVPAGSKKCASPNRHFFCFQAVGIIRHSEGQVVLEVTREVEVPVGEGETADEPKAVEVVEIQTEARKPPSPSPENICKFSYRFPLF